MKNTNIGLIGYGHLGKALHHRLQEKGFDEVQISQGRGKNVEMLDADLVILSVRPLQLAEVAREIRGKLRSRVLSFTAATPKVALQDALKSDVLRAMTDIQFEQILAEMGERDFLSSLSENPLIEVADEELVDAHTILVGCLPGVLAWQLVNNREGAMEWIERYFAFIQTKLGIAENVLHNILGRAVLDRAPASTIKKVATPGGITESLIQQLELKCDSSLDELYAAGWARTERVRTAVAASFKA
jgi:pyrroline-5-carboxylate reductase